MTRETKVGLLFGLGLVLVAGIFLTDYLSVAQRRLAPEMTDFAIEAQESLVPPHYDPAEQPGGMPAPDRVIERPRGITPDSRGPTPVTVDHGPAPKVVRRVIESPRHGRPQEREIDVTPPALADHAAPAPAPTAIQPAHHTVEAEETLWVIAKHYYGDGSRWRDIQQANPTRVDASGNVKAGVRLVIPNTSVRPSPPSPSSPAVREQTRWVKVRARDTLSTIAARELGSPKLWRAIYEANLDRVKDPDRLKIGLTLRVPVRG